ncbi:WD repeat-containing protein 6 [Diaporthe australafricana]|uniref:WD repeat-containing protein 6 n=1 Tax=Diaporthe australafricana TaxID=127596 RepID=A0ABR3Y2Q7_9PEZI
MNHNVPPRLQREHVHCPITALGFFRPADNGAVYILSGEDTHLKIYDAETQRLRASVHVFKAQPIQGISVGAASDVLIWGGPFVTALPWSKLAGLLQPGEGAGCAEYVVPNSQVLQAPDWVYHGAISPHRPGLAAVVTAHNEVIPLRIGGLAEDGGGGRELRFGGLRSPPSRPILYSAQVRWTSEDEVLVAAGTVFGEIIVWKCRVTEDDDDCEDAIEVLHVFTGHDGSIFGVDISPKLVIDPRTGEVSRLLASCSDDRTIRVWNISHTGSSGEKASVDHTFTEARETGFGENTSATELEAMASHHSCKPLAIAMGHVSRIWNVRFSSQGVDLSASEGGPRSMKLYSFGEDATAQRWRLDLDGKSECALPGGHDQEPVTSLTHEATFHNHDGKHIWSSALYVPSPSSPSKTLLATGGSDGKIHIIEESSARVRGDAAPSVPDASSLSSTPSVHETNPTSDYAPQPEGSGCAESEPLHMYGLPSAKAIIATTASGRILAGSLGASGVSWKETSVPQPIRDDLRKYQILRSAGPDFTLIGSPSGQLYIYGSGVIRPVVKLPRKIAEICVLPLEAFRELRLCEAQPGQVPIIVTTMGSPEVRIMLLDPATDDVVLQDALIELEKGFIPTAAGICQDFIIFGSRIGTLSLHRLDQNERCFRQIAQVGRSGSKDSVSSIVSLPAKPGLLCPYFLTTSRDGRYRIYETATKTSGSDNALTVNLRHEAVPPLGPMIESGFFTTTTTDADSKPQLILCGFRSKDFVVWNETQQQELASVECGGGHRAFTYHVDPATPSKLSFVWNKASRTCVYAQDGVSQWSLKPGGHGREIKAAAAGQGGYLATGAEDTNIRIWRVDGDREGGGLSCVAVVEKHTTGIQNLKWAGESHLVSSSGGEELFVWRVARLERSAYEGIAVVCEGVYPDKTRDGDLRIMSFDVHVLDPAAGGEEEEDQGEVLCLSLVLSNSTLKTYRYSRDDGFTLLAQARYTGACLMQIRHLRVQHESDGSWDLHVLTASMDGYLALWKTTRKPTTPAPLGPDEYELIEAQRLHQSAVKAMDLRELPQATFPPSYAVVTGGDDNAIGHVRLDWRSEGFSIASRSVVNGAHAAAITGLCIVGLEAAGVMGSYRLRLCTASNDQRVKSWVAVVGDGGIVGKLWLVSDRYSAIADCGDLEQLAEGRVVVAGVGMEFWNA